MSQKSSRWTKVLLPCFVSLHALVQILVSVDAFAQTPDADAEATVEDSVAAEGAPAATPSHRGLEAALRLGAALPLGKAGRDVGGTDRKLSDLVPWRAPIWVDVAYRVSPAASIGAYGQLSFGGTGDGCDGECDWSDLRIGVQGQWRFNPEGTLDPWLGLGVGWESLSYRSVSLDTFSRTTELLGGPELLLQGGLELQVEKFLHLGPYVSAGLGNYLRDSYKCLPDGPDCPAGSSVAGPGFHTWLGFGLSGRFSP
jgi:hypothetical protein